MKMAASPSSARPHERSRGFTRKELLVVVCVIVGLLFVAFALRDFAKYARANADRIRCANNLKSVGLGFRIFANDHDDKYPFTFDPNGATNPAYRNETEAWVHFQVLSNTFPSVKEFAGIDASVLTCDADQERLKNRTKDFAELATKRNEAISYFVGLTADERKPMLLLAGDRCVGTNQFLQGNVLTLKPGDTLSWDQSFHRVGGSFGVNVTLADGSVEQLNEWVGIKETNRLLLPLLP